ncbi:MAG TPA: hypothetical protein VLX59_15035 [Acidimicrobiales bacterium]|nr:hypothetical protein [Acidimicrobiales bacterium]
MNPLLAFSHNTSVTVAEVAFLLLLIAGVWTAVAWFMEGQSGQRWRRFRMIVAGILIAGAGLLLIIATYWGQLFR